MQFNGVEFDTYFKNYPDENGFFGKYGGAYVSDELKRALLTPGNIDAANRFHRVNECGELEVYNNGNTI